MLQKIESHRDWEWKRLGDVAEFINGRAFKPSEWSESGLPIIRIQNLNDYSKQFNYFEGEVESRYIVKNGDLLISWSASLGAFIWSGEKAVLNQHIFRVEVNETILDKKFLFYVVQTKIEEMKLRVHGSTMKHITKGQFDNIKIPVPSLLIQRKIVEVLEYAERLKQRRKKANEETDKVLQAIFMKMFGDPSNSKFPVKKLEEISHKINDGTHFTPKYLEEGVPFLRVTDLTNSNDSKKYISQEEHEKLTRRCKPEKGDILYSKNGTIGVAKLVDWDYDFSIFVSLCLIKPKRELALSKYLEVFLNTPFALRQALSHSKKGTITNLHLIDIKKILVPLPPVKEQERFLEIVRRVEKIEEYQKSSTRQISSLFDTLMQKSFNGELIK